MGLTVETFRTRTDPPLELLPERAGVIPDDHSGIVRRTWQEVVQKRDDPHPEQGPRLLFVVIEVE